MMSRPNSLKRTLLGLAFAIGALGSVAQKAQAQVGAAQQVLLEYQLQQRVYNIVAKADPQAIIQVKVDIVKMSSSLPGVWSAPQQATPVATDGSLAADGIEAVHVRVATQIDKIPDWLQAEVKAALNFDKVKIDTKFEKAKGTITKDEQKKEDQSLETMKSIGKDLVEGFSKSNANSEISKQISTALWGLAAGLVVTMILLVGAIFFLGRKIETSFFRVVDEKLAPLMQAQANASRGRDRSSETKSAAAAEKAAAPARAATASGGEFSQISDASLFAVVMDCYWTEADSYANFIWNELSMKQRDGLLTNSHFGQELFRYFQYVRQFSAENLGYHNDVQYVDAGDAFAKVDQKDLAKFISANPAQAIRVTPLRWDRLPISLSDRLKATLAMNSEKEAAAVSAPPSLKASALRPLPRRLEVKTLSAEDEAYLWQNPKMVAPDLRASLKTLVWLALCPLSEREKILGDIDARDLAEAWIGPADVLENLKAAVPAKKFEMVQFYMKDATPDRDGAIFGHLVATGAQMLNETGEPNESAAKDKAA